MRNIVIIFPGLGYTAEKPLLYYGLNTARECGYTEVRKLVFAPKDKSDIRGNEPAMRAAFEELSMQAEEQLKDIDWSLYDDILFISKSIGTIIAGAYANAHGLDKVKHVLYTPLKYTYQFKLQKAIAFIGSGDAWSNYSEVAALSEKAGVPIAVFEDCNHSLEAADDVNGNIERLAKIMKATKDFLK